MSTPSSDDLGWDAPSMWRWLRSQPPLAELDAPSELAARATFAIEENGDLSVIFGESSPFALRFVFAPAPWGPSTVRIGANLVVPAEGRAALVDLAARQLETDAPKLTANETPRAASSFLVGVDVSRQSSGGARSMSGVIQLLTLEKPRVALLLHFAFTLRSDDTSGDDGWILFRGPRGKQSRTTLVSALARFLE